MTATPSTDQIPARPARTSPQSRRIRRYVQGAALVLVPALLVPQALIDPTGNGSGDLVFDAATEHRGALVASAMLLLVSAFLVAPAAAAVLHQARDRGSSLANVGAALIGLGAFGHAGIAMFYLFGSALPGGNRAEMVGYVDRLNESPVLGLVAFPLILCFAIGAVILPWAAWRAGTVGLWAPIVATVAVLVEEVLPFGSTVTDIAVLGAITVVFGALGVRVLRMTDAEWEGARQPGDRPGVVRA